MDGTENPGGVDAAAAVTVGAEDPQFAGSSYVTVQKYVHDLTAWNALSVEEQERVIGRTKLSNVELPDDVKPSNSHVALNTIVGPDGEERQILRDNMPFGSVGDGVFGTYYIAYSSTPDVTEEMLEHMFIGDPPGNYDRILDFSTPLTGTLFFVPRLDFLENPPPARMRPVPAPPLPPPPARVSPRRPGPAPSASAGSEIRPRTPAGPGRAGGQLRDPRLTPGPPDRPA